MKRKGLKITVIILTVLTYLSIAVSFKSLLEIVHNTNLSGLQGLEGVVAAALYFAIIGMVLFFVLSSLIVMSGLSILFCSIDLNKSINYNDNMAFDIVFMSINFIVYMFIVGIIMYMVR